MALQAIGRPQIYFQIHVDGCLFGVLPAIAKIYTEDVVPRLREMARSHGIEISLFDLRWGVRDENTLDHRTWETCYAEIQNCASKSIGAFFLSLQGGKYGYCPLPRTINKQLFDDRLATEEDDSLKVLAHKWYYLDENALPSPGISNTAITMPSIQPLNTLHPSSDRTPPSKTSNTFTKISCLGAEWGTGPGKGCIWHKGI